VTKKLIKQKFCRRVKKFDFIKSFTPMWALLCLWSGEEVLHGTVSSCYRLEGVAF
jgi:hypothetical protein